MVIPSFLSFQRRALTGSLLLAVMLMTGCAILEGKDKTAGWTAEEFLSTGQKQMSSGDWVGAIETYKKLLGRFPYGRSAEQAQLDTAYAYFKNDEPALTVAAAGRFIQMHPTHPNVDYAFYLKGLALFEPPDSLFDSLSGYNPANNDIGPVREAFVPSRDLIGRFPATGPAPDPANRWI